MKKSLIILLVMMVASCDTYKQRLKEVGKAPNFSDNSINQLQINPQPAPPKQTAGSLWQPGSRAFFRDQRARSVGDILTILVSVNDNAALKNDSTRSRQGSEAMGASRLGGLEAPIATALPTGTDLSSLIGVDSSSNYTGSGSINRQEQVNTQIAALVTEILPNGNLVVKGSQQIRVNFEMREVSVEGVVRPEDITAENSVKANQLAEAKISYGGKGFANDVQQPRIGSQVIDIISPF